MGRMGSVTSRSYLIGLTGNIATGKSTVAQILAEWGALVIDADLVAHKMMQLHEPTYAAVVEAFGPEILRADGTIDRTELGAIVFHDPAALQRLEEIVHPAVVAEVERRIAEATAPVVVVEAIKLIEAGMHHNYDSLWVVTAPRSLQITRLVASRHMTGEEATVRVDAQPPQGKKAALADQVFVNDGTLAQLRKQVRRAWAEIGDNLPSGGSPKPEGKPIVVRPVSRGDIDDAAGVASVLNNVIAGDHQTALTGYWTPEAEQEFIQGLGPRSEIFVAEVSGCIVGFQVIEPFVTYTSTMDHVAHFGTYVHAEYRGQGVGRQLAAATLGFAREQGYEKSVVYVLESNEGGLAYYKSLGFEERGVLTRQTKIGDAYLDEVIMELFFDAS
jgi:dephospho-CoA kinase